MCVHALDTACWGEGVFARVPRHFSIFPATEICLPESRGPHGGGAAGQRPADLPPEVAGDLILLSWGVWTLQEA